MQFTSPSQIAEELEDFIRKRFQISPGDLDFGRDADLWDGGYLDSLGVVEIIAFLQSRFAVSIPSEMLFDPDFVSINGMARLTFCLSSGSTVAA